MALYRITAPDGRTYEVQGPDGATQRQVEAELLRQNPMAGLTSKELEETPRAPSTIKDIGLGGLGALAGGVQALTNIAGVDNPVSKGLGSIQQYAQENLTPARQEELAIQGELESRAQGTGLANEVGTGIRRFTQAPVQGTVNALLGSAPIIAAGFIPGGQVAAGAGLGARALAGARGATGIGGLMGVGGQKGQDYEAVKEALLAKGLDPTIAEQRAIEASAYSGENLPRQLLAGGAGALEGMFGVEQVIANAAKKVSKGVGAPSLDAPSYGRAIGLTMLGEAAPEAVQAAVGQVGTNIALNQAGVEKDLTEGLAGTVAHDALVGSVLGLAVSPAQMSNLQRQYKQTLADEQARKQAETDAQIQAATQKAEAERAVLQKQTDEIRQQMEQQQAIALPAPSEEIPVEEVQTDPLKNPLGNIRKSEVPFDIYKQIDEYRKQAGLPKLKEYSIEDFVDAMPGQNPKAEQGLLDQLITAKSGYAGEKYTAQDILNQAKLKNVDTTTKGFKDFLARTTGASALEQMSQPQLHAAFKSLNSLPASEGLNILPEGTNARRFDEKQYDKAIKGVDFLLAELGVPVDPSEVIKTIKEYTNLTEDSHAGAILDTAIKNGDVDLIKTPRYEIYDPKTGAVMPSTYTSRTAARAAAAKRGLNVRQITTDAIAAPSTSATLPEGFDIREGSFKQGEAPAGYDVLAGDEVLFKANTVEEANAKKDSFERTRAGMANARENQITQLNNAIEASQKRLTTMEAQGKGQTTGYQKAAGKHAKMVADTQAKIAALTEEIKKFDPKVTALAVKPTGTKAIGRKGYTVFEQGQSKATYSSRQAAEEGILAEMDDKQLQELTQQQGRRAIGKKAQAELERRTPKAPTAAEAKRFAEQKPVSEVLEGIETEAKAQKAKAEAAKETPEVKEKLAKLEAELKPMLAKFGLGGVKLNFVEKMDAEGSYNESLIKIALDEKEPVRILRHESLHALKDLNFFTPQQWTALERMAKDQWIDKYLKKKVVEHKGKRMSAHDAYVDLYNGDMAKVTEEAIAEAFADFANNKPPAGMLAALLKRLNDFFTALRNALNGAGFQTYEDVFGKIERGELSQKPSSWKANDTVKDDAVKYSMRFGIDPYTSEGQINVPLDGDNTRFSIKQPYDQKKLSKDETLKNDPITGLPLNANGTVTLYYPTTNESARDLAETRKLKGHSPTANRIYLTNESSSAAITNKPGMIDQPVGGANVLLQVDPSVIHLLEEHSDGRKDFFIPIAEGKAFEKKMAQTKLFTLNAPRTKGLHPDRTLKQVTTAVNDAATKWANSSAADRRIMARNAKDVLRAEHNISRLFGANSKLEKTNIGEYGLTYNGKKVMSTGLGFASAQKINDEQRATTCPQSGICEDLCLGETSGQNLLYGGEGQWRSGPRLSQYLKTEALVVNPEAFAIAMIKQIESFRKAARDLDYHPAIRLNVTSDFNPATFENIINMFPDVTFYDYTKLDTKPIAPNHHLTYSSTGASQVVGKKTIFNKFSNWDRMVDKILPSGRNVAMAFTSRSAMPKFVKDERTGKTFEVWNGDEYDARFLDPVKESGDGLIIGLTNKDNTTKPEDAAAKHNGFFLDYDPERDGDTLVIPNQEKLKGDQGQPVTFSKKPRFSLRSVPPEPGTEPIPQGMVRLYHQTDGQSLDKIAKEGLSIKYAKGIEGPKAIYAGEQPFYGAADSRPTLEFFVPKAQWDAPFVLEDVKPEQIIAAHYPWHKTARYLESEPQSMQSALDGQYDDLKDPDTSKAVEYIKEKYSKTDERMSLREAPDTPEFKQFFAGSKVVDEDGKPLVVYHGSPDFKGNAFTGKVERKNRAGNVAGYYFTPYADEASDYAADRKTQQYQEGSQVLPVYLNIKRPYIAGESRVTPAMKDAYLKEMIASNQHMSDERAAEWAKTKVPFFKDGRLPSADALNGDGDAMQRILKAGGYDGFKDGRHWVAFESSQVKSSIGNVGTYGSGNPDIRYSLRQAPDTPEFQEWFGDSKIVDANGQPLVVSHISKAKPTVFDKKYKTDLSSMGFHFGTKEQAEFRGTQYDFESRSPTMGDYYLSIQNPLEVSHMASYAPDHLADQMMDMDLISVEKYDSFRDKYSSEPEIGAALVKILQKAGYDGLVYSNEMEGAGNSYVPFESTQIKSATDNTGAYSKYNPDVRYSLRESTDPATVNRVNATTTTREEKGFADRITKAFSGDSFSVLRQQALNRYQRLAEYDKQLAKQMGGVALMADVSAEAGALQSDLAAGVTASVLGVHDRNGGIPVYANGVTKAFNDNGKIKGPVAIFAPLSKYNDPYIYQLYQFWAAAQRGSRLNEQGRPDIFTDEDLKKAQQLEKDHPEFRQIQEEWTTFNNGLVQFLVDTGVLSEGDKARFTEYSDYIPFYRQMEGEKTIGPNLFQSISGVKKPKKLGEGTDKAPLADFLETVVRNTQSSIQMGMKNVAAQRAIDVAVKIDMAERLHPKAKAGLDTVQVLEKGQVVTYQVADHMFIEAVKSLNMPDLPFIGLLSGPANFLRNMVTKDPGFMLANMVRDSMAAYVTSGVKMTPVADTVRNFGKAMANTSPEYEALLNAGILGGYEFSQNIETSAKSFERELKKKYEGKSTFQRMLNPMTAPRALWDALEKGTTASDAATRIEVYKRTLAETKNEAEALHRALEVMNFNRKGSSAVVRILTAAIPFLNARMQGLDVLYRAGISPTFRQLMYGEKPTDREKSVQKAFIVRGLTMAALSAMYWTLTHDDDEYKRQEQETKDNNWLIPSLGIKIPIPFEIGVIFKVIPERLMALTLGDDTNKDFMDSMIRNLRSTLAIDYLPQAIKPFVETETNFSLFTRRAIVGQGLEGVAPEFQVGPGTSSVATAIGSTLGMSPMKIDHLIGGYTGTMGMYMVSALDGIMNMNADTPNASKRFEQMPLIKRFALDPEARGTVTSYYDLKNATDEAVRTSSLLERTMNFEERNKYMQDNIRMLATKDYILDLEKTMKEFRQMQVLIRSSKMDADAKREALLRINQAQNALTANINMIRANVM
jgi:hypothetical protein